MAHILVVDDEEDVLISIRDVLLQQKHEVTLTSSGSEALRVLEERVPDAIIIDIVMPEMHGLELCERIRVKYTSADVAILVLSARGRPEDIQRALDIGADSYIVKPFGILSLPDQVRDILARRNKS